jgi:putative membrane protein
MGWLVTFVTFVVAWLLAALVIFIVGKLGMGMTVDGFVPALIAAAVIAVIGTLLTWLVVDLLGIGDGGGWWGALIGLLVSAVTLLFSDRFVKGMKVNGFGGAIIAAIGIGLVTWLAGWIASLFA